MAVTGKKRYIPDLTEMMAECEANYARLMKLMPDMEQQPERVFGINFEHHENGRICLSVVEKFKYTVTLKLTQQDVMGRWLKKPSLLIRLYHDARMAEVVECDNKRQLRGAYSYPNAKMYQSDEKMQLNLYLGEWLRQCLSHGYAIEDLNFARVS